MQALLSTLSRLHLYIYCLYVYVTAMLKEEEAENLGGRNVGWQEEECGNDVIIVLLSFKRGIIKSWLNI